MVVVKKVVDVFNKVIIINVWDEYLIKGEYFVKRNILVVIIVVVWIKVDIGVGFFIVFGNYVWRFNWVDFLIVFIKSNRLI